MLILTDYNSFSDLFLDFGNFELLAQITNGMHVGKNIAKSGCIR